MRKVLPVAALLLVAMLAVPAVAIGAAISSAVADTETASQPSALALKEIPIAVISVEAAAAASCPGLPWQVLAAANLVGDPTVFAHLDTATGAVSGPLPTVGVGPFAFSDATWASYKTTWPSDPKGALPSPSNDYDETYTLALALCELSADDTSVRQLLEQYDATPSWFDDVWNKAVAFGMNPDGSSEDAGAAGADVDAAPGSPPPAGDTTYPIYEPPGRTFDGSRAALVEAAETQLGVPYVWGGITAGQALDCSGLVVVAMQALGFNLLWQYRTSQGQATLGVEVPPDQVGAGDLLVMPGDDSGDIVPLGHFGIAISNTEMIEAPYTGQVVQIAPIPWNEIETARRILTQP